MATARWLRVDPLDLCSHRYGLGASVVFERAADWVGLAFSPVVPSTGEAHVEVRRIDAFAQARSIREKLFDREVVYLAPRFSALLQLKTYLVAYPEMRHTTCITPPSAIRAGLAQLSAPQLLDEARQRLSRRWPFASASLDLGRWARLVFVTGLIGLSLLAALWPLGWQSVLLPLVTVELLVPAAFKLVACIAGRTAAPRPEAPPIGDAELPVYSVLVPLRDEAQMVPLLRRMLGGLDYPAEKLDIKFVVEERSPATLTAVRQLLDDPRFEVVVVPEQQPLTKPKALDYALPFVRGTYVVVYDAEDIANPDQLRLAAAGFAADPGVDCLQAELVVDNARENLLTGLFAGEYAAQFGIVMPALARWNLPIPLGGTSNHFRTRALREVGSWDAFNVTEDADLGIRLARLRYRTEMLSSQTYEEAPVNLGAWMGQRTRWMKGWMQTLIVHNRDPRRLWQDLGWRNFIAFEIYIGSLIVSPLLHTAFLVSLGIDFARHSDPFAASDSMLPCWLAILLFGYAGSILVVVAGLLRLGQRRLLLLQLLLPAYWVLHAIATIRACIELLTRPHFWAKTTHGLTRLDRSFNAPATPLAPEFEDAGR